MQWNGHVGGKRPRLSIRIEYFDGGQRFASVDHNLASGDEDMISDHGGAEAGVWPEQRRAVAPRIRLRIVNLHRIRFAAPGPPPAEGINFAAQRGGGQMLARVVERGQLTPAIILRIVFEQILRHSRAADDVYFSIQRDSRSGQARLGHGTLLRP